MSPVRRGQVPKSASVGEPYLHPSPISHGFLAVSAPHEPCPGPAATASIRVVCLTPGYAPALSFGGPTESTHRLCLAMLAAGVQIRVLTTDIGQVAEMPRAPAGQWVQYEGIPVKYCRRRWPGTLSRSFVANLPGALQHADIAHVTGTFSFTALASALACILLRKPFVLSPRGTLEPWSLAHKRWKKAPALEFLRPLLNRASAIHATSEKEAKAIIALGLAPPVVVIPNGVDLSAASSDNSKRSEAWRHRLGIAQNAPFLLVLGRMHYVKGIDIALEAFVAIGARWPNAVLVLAGPDSEGYGARMDVLARQLGISSTVRRLGYVGGTEKYQLLAEADLLLLPSRQENFGNVVVEALSVGTPVVASRNTPWKELEDQDCGRWVDFDARSLAASVTDLLGAPDRRRGMGERGRALVSRKYAWNSIAHSMRRVYRACISGERPLPHEFTGG